MKKRWSKQNENSRSVFIIFTIIIMMALLVSCTTQLPGTLRLAQQEEVFQTAREVNTKIDLLWVVDNSSSMDVSQEKLRNGFAGFANKYLQPTWDIQIAVITTDTYLANPAFQTYLNTTIPGSNTWTSNYLKSKTVVSNPIYDKATESFPFGVKYKDLTSIWGPEYSKLLPNIHDGPIPGFCFEGLPYFLKGLTQCDVRDRVDAPRGVDHCLSPSGSESAVSQCVNTLENNTVRSGKPILTTVPPAGVIGDAAKTAQWIHQLIRDFRVNVTTGSVGFGSERGFASVLQLLSDNETSGSAFFRTGSLRGIIFVSDEDDQSMEYPTTVPAGFNPWSHYQCDESSLLALNPTGNVNGAGGYCCSNPSNHCRYGSEGTSCPSKTVEGGAPYRVSLCPKADLLMSVGSVKSRLDGFFTGLDHALLAAGDYGSFSYFVASIVVREGSTISNLQSSRDLDDQAAGVTLKTIAVDRGDRYIELANAIGNGSLVMDIGAPDYSPILDAIGKSIVEKKGSFKLVRPPTNQEETSVKVVRADGSSYEILATQYEIDDRILRVTDLNVVLGFKASDQIIINYQPKTLY